MPKLLKPTRYPYDLDMREFGRTYGDNMRNGEIDAGTFFEKVAQMSTEAYASRLISEIKREAKTLGRKAEVLLFSAMKYIENFFKEKEWYPPERQVICVIFA